MRTFNVTFEEKDLEIKLSNMLQKESYKEIIEYFENNKWQIFNNSVNIYYKTSLEKCLLDNVLECKEQLLMEEFYQLNLRNGTESLFYDYLNFLFNTKKYQKAYEYIIKNGNHINYDSFEQLDLVIEIVYKTFSEYKNVINKKDKYIISCIWSSYTSFMTNIDNNVKEMFSSLIDIGRSSVEVSGYKPIGHCKICNRKYIKIFEKRKECIENSYKCQEEMELCNTHAELYCKKCFEDNFICCRCCKKTTLVKVTEDGLCMKCRNEKYDKCIKCKTYFVKEDLKDGICRICENKYFKKCEMCFRKYEKDKLNKGLCNECYKKTYRNCDLCNKEVHINSIIAGRCEDCWSKAINRNSSMYSDEDQNKTKKCSKCGRILSIKYFRDPNLTTRYGRNCVYCKKDSHKGRKSIGEYIEHETSIKCPKCGSNMVLRTGRHGKFYGCSKYPRCRGTREHY